MLGEMRLSEFGRWAALYAVDPWSEDRKDMRAAQVALQVARAHLKRADGSAHMIEDFMLLRSRPAPKDPGAALKQFLAGRPGGAKPRIKPKG